ncbi:MAG TPA: hypothetical protein VGG99_04045 [Acetobacteraceae bacterium]|jgi:hypothetical protein
MTAIARAGKELDWLDEEPELYSDADLKARIRPVHKTRNCLPITTAISSSESLPRGSLTLKIYQIALEDKRSSWFRRTGGEVWDGYKRLPPLPKAAAATLAAVAVAVAAAADTAVVAVVAAGATVVVVAKSAVDYFVGSGVSVEQIRSKKALHDFAEYHGDDWCGNGTFYIEHPKRPGRLVLAASFHRAMADEQMADLLAFYRSKFPVRSISIRMENRKFGVVVGATGGGPFSAKAMMHDERVLRIAENYDPAELVPLTEQLVWLDEFKSLQSGARRTSGGTTSFTGAHSLAFGLEAGISGAFGIEAGWCSEFQLSIEVAFEAA